MEITWSALESHFVARAIALWHELGNDDFVARTRFRDSKRYVVFDQGQAISSKPLVAMAYQLQYSCSKDDTPPLTGGDQTRSILKRLGYHLTDLRADDQTQSLESVSIWVDSDTKFWWVNQTANFDIVFADGTLWAPKKDNRGTQLDHWKSLEGVRPGDVVFHYGTPEIRGLSQIVTAPQTTYAPFGYMEAGTDTPGNLVLTKPLGRVSILREVALRTIGSGFGPVNAVGGLRNGYFFPLSTVDALELLSEFGVNVGEEPTTDDSIAFSMAEPNFSGLSDRSIVRTVRREQSFLREQQLKIRGNVCSLCGEVVPLELLVAAHIKPRWACSEDERMDIHHVSMLACLFGCDALFEHGYIVINDAGVIEPGPQVIQQIEIKTKKLVGRACSAFNDQSRDYYSWHRRYHAKGQNNTF